MNTKKKLLSLLHLMLISIGVEAQNAIAVYQKDGQVVKFAFTEKPLVTYSGSELILTTTKTTVQYPIYLLQKLDYGIRLQDMTGNELEDLTEVKGIKKRDVQFSFHDGTLFVSGGKPGSTLYIYNLCGIKAAQCRLDAVGNASIFLQGLLQDIYIVKTDSFSFKFKKP